MGNFEKLVVLTVLFLSAIVLGVSLSSGDGDFARAGGPLDLDEDPGRRPRGAEQATLESPERNALPSQSDGGARKAQGATPTSSSASFEQERSPADLLLSSAVRTDPLGGNSRSAESDRGRNAGTQATRDRAAGLLVSTAGLAASPSPEFMLFTCEGGETWEGLSSRFYGRSALADLLQSCNEGLSVLHAGQDILVPTTDFSQAEEGRDRLEPVARGSARPSGPAPSQAPSSGANGLAAAASHRVAAGENLSTISQRYYGTMTRWKDIFEANRDVLSNPDVLVEGVLLRIPR